MQQLADYVVDFSYSSVAFWGMLMVSTKSILPILVRMQASVDEQYCLACSNKLVPSNWALSLSLSGG